jgi:hypothetical protein
VSSSFFLSSSFSCSIGSLKYLFIFAFFIAHFLLVENTYKNPYSLKAVNARQDAINASVLQMVASRSTDGVDDNATAFSAMTASSAVKDKRIEDLES